MCEIMKCMRYLVCGISSVWDERRRGRGREVKEGRRRRHCSNNKNPVLRIWGKTSEFRSLNRCFSASGELHPALEMLRGASLTPRNRLELILKTQKNLVPAA